MNFYTMLMREGKAGNNDPLRVRKYIQQTNTIGFGDPGGGDGFSNFKNMESGDIVIIRAGGKTLAMVQIMTPNVDEYVPQESTSDFNWLCYTRSVKILSWYEDDLAQYNLPALNWGGYLKTCARAEANDFNVRKWYEVIMGNNLKNELKELLIKNYNVILTGAPGTGKTFLAWEIAKTIAGDKSRIKFCQFHPSFDYTDFVEGLRPIEPDANGNIGFERQDGIFKSFCKEAAKNFIDSQKTQEEINEEITIDSQIKFFLDAAIEGQKEFTTKNGNKFFIRDVIKNQVILEIPLNTRISRLKISYNEISEILTSEVPLEKVCDIRKYFKREYNRQGDSYIFQVCKEIKNEKSTTNTPLQAVSKQELHNFVFIIDEINRGDISKIFGELFFSIDPGYRRKKKSIDINIKTQYSNLLEDGDIFKDGFYVPENVYIIGTMNDIDRSVESMDFAIRRRFSWRKIQANETIAMWDNAETGIPQYKDNANQCMKRLNEVISKVDSLGESFQVGPSYFLKLKEYNGNFTELWDWHISPLLEEYLRGLPDAVKILQEFYNAYFDKPSTEPSSHDHSIAN